MLKPPPKTGDTALDNFLRGVYEKSQELEAKSIPEDGWSLTDLTAEVSGVIGDKRDLIDIVTQYDSIESYLALVKDQEELLKDALEKLNSIEVSADWFSQILEWWDQNYKIIQDAQESLTYKREADAAALEAKQYAAETEQDRVATDRNLEEAEKAASDAARYRQGALTYRDSSKRYSEASEAAQALSEAAQALSEQFRDSAKGHREAAATSESNAASSASAASTDANKAKGSATEAAGEVAKATEIRGQVEVIETALRALMEDTEAWQDVSFALESVDGRISTGMQQVKNDILGGVGPAFDTLLELAEALGENADAIGTLTNELAKKADKGHTHVSADITGATAVLHANYPDRVVKTREDGQIYVYTETITAGHSVANKTYVDAEVAKKANVSHTHVISDTSGLQTALDGKAPSSHVHSISDVDGLEAQLAARAAKEHKHEIGDVNGLSDAIETEISTAQRSFRVKLQKTSGSSYYWVPQSLPRSLYAGNNLRVLLPSGTWRLTIKNAAGHSVRIALNGGAYTTKPVADDTHEEVRVSDGDDWVLFSFPSSTPAEGDQVDLYIFEEDPGKASLVHQHVSAEIADAVDLTTTGTEGKLVKVSSTGNIQSYVDPSEARDLTRKFYVDREVAKKANSSHTHSVSEVTGLQAALDAAGSAEHTHPVTDITASGTRGSNTYLRGDGTWATPTNTTYSVPSQAEAEAGTATTGRAFSAQRVSQAIAAKAAPKSHTHTSSEISDSINGVWSGLTPNMLLRTFDDGYLHSSVDPLERNHVPNKAYVDARTPKIEVVSALPSSPDPNTVYIVK